MHCAACGHENRPGRKFCGECGAGLALACPACGTANEPGEKFCGECGAALGSSAPAGAAAPARPGPEADARKVVTIVFADLVGSTALHERLDPESVRRVMDRYYAALRTAVDAHGGTVVKLLGDGVMAAFGLKRVAEDDALRAVRAAAAMQDAFRALVQTSAAALGAAGLRVAVNTGEVVVSGAQDDVIGDPVNVAARLQEQGRDGDVVLGEATRRLVATRVTLAPLGSVALKGRAEAVRVYRLESLAPPAGVAATPFVGREDELARLEAVYAATIAMPATRLAVLVGSPGLGKSRLIAEVARRHGDDATILGAHCDAAGGATFAPLAQAVRRFLGLADGATGEAVRMAVAAVLHGDGDDGERARIAGGIDGLLGGSAMSPEETFFVVRRFLAGLAAAKPAVLVIDDVHWAEPLLLDLVEHLVQWGSGVPLFVLVGARPELRELRSSLVTAGGVVADAVVLGGLDAGAAMRLAAGVIGAADLPAAVAAKVLATSEGNPLFVGELVRMLVQEGALTKDGERWTAGANLAAFEMPPTIHALLAARIERLGHGERTVLERAAVVGRHFSRSAVAALLGGDGAELDARLESLRRNELIERDTGWLLGEPALRFHHVLIRDAAYRRLLKGTRADLHERLADWIEGQVGDAAEHDETIGWHLEQAHQHLRELGPLDVAGTALGERAARRLSAAGRRALARDDVSLAAGLLGRAHARLAVDAPERADLVLDWCEALLAAGDVGPAADAIAELSSVVDAADRGARDASNDGARDASDDGARDASDDSAGGTSLSARLRAWHTCFAGQLTVLTAPEALHATADRVGAAARDLAALNDAAGEAKAHFVHAQALARLGKIGASEAALDQALAAARRAGDRRRANAVLAGAPLAALWGPSPVTRASGRCLDVVRVLRITQGAPAVEAVALSCQGVLEALRGRAEAARRMLASSRTMVEELGISHRLYEADVFAGRIDLLEGDALAAERALRAGYDGLRDLGLGIDAARAAALLGRALLAQDRAAEAEALSHESELLAGDDLQAAIAWRGVRAEALARRGDHAAAIAFAEAAVAIAAATDALLDHADARLALAAALRAAGRQPEADAEERRAFELWEAKGATVLADRARRTRSPVASPGAVSLDRGAPPRRTVRRVRANDASALAARFEATFTADDADAVAALWSDALEVVDHANGAAYDRAGHLASIRRLRRASDPRLQFEALATLGASLCLTRRCIASSGTGGGKFDVGGSEYEAFVLFEVDERGSGRRIEIFSADHLGEGVARSYERYAEQLPEGPAREHAATAARAVAFLLTAADAPELSTIYAASYEDVDHRTVGYGHVSGDALGKLDQSLRALADDLRFRIDDVLALEPHGFVRTTTSSGTWRDGGGAFERTVCTLTVFGPDGRVTNHETFDADREAEALARFDALAADAVSQPSEGRRGGSPRLLRANATTAAAARFDAAFAARDEAGLAALCADDLTVVDHPTGADYGRDGVLESHRRLLRMDGPTMRYEPLATLGECLALFRRRIRASGGRLDVGEYERDEIVVAETDAAGRFRHHETFATERLRAAIGRLYERYAASLPEGSARVRSEGVARGLAVYDGPLDPECIASAHSPSFVCVDHRIFGTWPAEGREAWRTHWQEQAELAAAFTPRDDDVLALDAGAYVLRTTFGGMGRASGGTIENVVISINVHDVNGLIARVELFAPDQEAEALARFARLTAEAAPPPRVRRPVRPNAATRTITAIEAAFARRDLAAVDALFGESLETIEHPTATRYGRAGQLESSRRMMQMPDLCFRVEPLATLGDALYLARRVVSASATAGGRFDVGAFEIESIVLTVVDAAGRITALEVFAPDHLGTALARLHARYAESLPAGPERMRAEGIARNYEFWNGMPDPEGFRSVLAPAFVMVDHRSLGTWAAVGADEWIRHWRVQAELAEGFRRRDDDLLAFTPAVHVLRQTFVGTNRASGGPFENVVLAVCVFDADGRVARAESYEPDEEALALARFDELVAGEQPAPPSRRRVRANAATPSLARFQSALAARDRDAIGDVFAESLQFIHHPTGATYGRRETLGKWRSIMKAEQVSFRGEALGTLGESAVLERHTLAIDGLREEHLTEFGRLEFDEAVVIEVDEAGRWSHVELFEAERLGDAVARLYARHAEQLPEGPARTRAVMTARAVATMLTRSTEHRLEDVSTPDIEAVDHRAVGMGTVSGPDLWTRWRAASDELMQDQSFRVEDVLALGPDALLRRTTETGNVRASGGGFENGIWILSVFGSDGRQSRIELFDVGREAEALARFDALAPARVAAPVGRVDRATGEGAFANAATRTLDRFAHVTAARDWDGLADLCAADLRYDRRPLFQMQLGKEGFLQQHRVLFDVPNARWVMRTIATRGERLTLSQIQLQGDGGGALEIEHLGVIEVDDDGRMTAIVLFEPADLDAAYAALDARYDAGEGAAYGRVASSGAYARAYAQRDWDAIAAMCTPTFAEHDHRAVALLGTRRGPAAWAETERALVELAPDSIVRFNHVRSNARGGLSQLTFYGADGGYEIPFLSVTELGAGGKLERNDLYDPEQLDEALARYAEISAPAPSTEPFANAASAMVAPVMAAIVAHDWQRLTGLYADDFRLSDRRRVAQLELDRDQFVSFTREVADGRTVRATSELLATRGERLALTRPVYELSDDDVGPSQIALIVLTEVDACGRGVWQVRWDVEDLVAARSELDRRWHAVEQVEHPRVAAFHVGFTKALAARDWDALAAVLAPTLAAHDHRLVGWDVRHGPDAYVEVVRAMVDLAPDADGRLDHARTCGHGFLAEVVWVGTRDGGAFESPFLWVVELDDAGRAVRFDFYDPHHLEAARARFAEIHRSAPQAARAASPTSSEGTRDPFAAIAAPNLATTWWDRWKAAQAVGVDTGSWDAMRALVAPGFVFDDRQRRALVRGDIELFIASARERAAMGARPEGTRVGTAGERIAIEKMLWSGGPSDGRFEIEYLAVIEVDETGRIVALILYDLDDARAAQRHAWARWAAIEPAVAPWFDIVGACVDAFNAHDRERLSAPFADDVVVEDHRRTGFGRIEGAAAYAEAVAVLWELAPDHHLELGWFWPVVERHGFVITLHRFGTLADGGAFESHALFLCLADGRRITRVELFELDDLDRARARLVELRPDPLRIPPNAATRAWDRWCDAALAGALDVVEAMYHPAYRSDDRRPLMRLTTDRAGVLENDRFLVGDGWRPARTLLATAGDRLALQRILWTVGEAGGHSEVEILQVSEVDDEGRFVFGATFDPGDRAAASAELFERYAASGADGTTPAALDLIRAWNAHDLERLRALLPAEFYLDDHRRTGVGRLEGRDAYVDSLAALWELSHDIRLETLYSIAVTPHGRLWVCRWFGSNAEGGAFDAVYVCVGFREDDRGCLEIFELEDIELARARFMELRDAAS